MSVHHATLCERLFNLLKNISGKCRHNILQYTLVLMLNILPESGATLANLTQYIFLNIIIYMWNSILFY